MTSVTASPTLKRRHMTAAVVGNALECYDFLTYAFFAAAIGHAFFPAKTPFISLMISLSTFGAGFLTRPLGALLLGLMADKAGRKPAMMLSFTLMGVTMLMMALTPTYAQIGWVAPVIVVATRLLQGLSVGGEIGVATTYLVEAAPPGRRGFTGAWQYATQGVATLVAGMLGLGLTHALGTAAVTDWGWRIAFLAGAILLPIGILIRRDLPETLHEAEPHNDLHVGPTRTQWRVIILGMMIVVSSTVQFYILNFMTTYAGSVLHMKANISFAAPVVNGLSTIVFSLGAGALSDRFGRKPLMLWPRVLLMLATWPAFAFAAAHRDAPSLLLATLVLSALGQAAAAAGLVSVTESLSKPVRGTSLAMLYACAVAVMGGITQPMVTWLIHQTGDVLWPAWWLIAASAVGVVAALLMRETAPAVT